MSSDDLSPDLNKLLAEIKATTRRWEDLSDADKLKIINDLAFDNQKLRAAMRICRAAKVYFDRMELEAQHKIKDNPALMDNLHDTVLKAISDFEAAYPGELEGGKE